MYSDEGGELRGNNRLSSVSKFTANMPGGNMTDDLHDPSYHNVKLNPTQTQELGAGNEPRASLGILAKSPSLPEGETPIPDDILRFLLQNEAAKLMSDERVAICLKRPIPNAVTVEITHSISKGKAHFKNLQVCGSVWMCPVCASKVSETRRQELSLAIAKTDYQPMLLTFTMQHHKGDKLADLLRGLMAAFDSFKSGQYWQKKRKEYGWIGSIRAIEVTYGDNGWHPHLHDLVLLEKPLDAENRVFFTNLVKERWQMVLKRHGYFATLENGADVREGHNDIAEYVAKYGRLPKVTGWTVVHEVTKAVSKKAHRDGRTAYQLLADSMAGDKPSGRLFMEYARVFKGKRQLVWSEGLRALLGLTDEKTDEQIARENDEAAYVLLYLTIDQWKIVVRENGRAGLLAEAAHGDRERVVAWLADYDIHVYDNELFQATIPLVGGIGLGLNKSAD